MSTQQGEPVHFIHVGEDANDRTLGDQRSRWLESLDVDADAVEVRSGVPWIELVRAAGQQGAAFLIAGTHGETGFQPLRLGTTAGLVALRCPTPVVLVPPMFPAGYPAGRSNERLPEERR
jgi:nucleotide-binding universal stress UspA family protein